MPVGPTTRLFFSGRDHALAHVRRGHVMIVRTPIGSASAWLPPHCQFSGKRRIVCTRCCVCVCVCARRSRSCNDGRKIQGRTPTVASRARRKISDTVAERESWRAGASLIIPGGNVPLHFPWHQKGANGSFSVRRLPRQGEEEEETPRTVALTFAAAAMQCQVRTDRTRIRWASRSETKTKI